MIRTVLFTLAILIAVTSQQMAVARGLAKDAGGQVILCTGQGPVTVTLDGQGNPMGLVHICPDCALTLFAGWIAPQGLCGSVFHTQYLSKTPVKTLESAFAHRLSSARDPPRLL